MKLHHTASDRVTAALANLGRTEDIRFSPDGRRLAIAGFNRDVILLLGVELTGQGKRTALALTSAMEITSERLAYPHGLSFIDDSLLLVANREASAPILTLPAVNENPGPLEVPALEPIPGELWLHSPGSVCCYQTGPGQYQALICNNYAHYVTRHTLTTEPELIVSDNELLLAKGLDTPDGVAISDDRQWIAVSNHIEQTIRLYTNDDTLNPKSEPAAMLRGTAYPHGILFARGNKFLVVADAGTPFLRIYARSGREWNGEHHPVLSIRTMSDEIFSLGNDNVAEGGIKGIDFLPGTEILAATSEHQSLVFFDLGRVLQLLSQHRGQSRAAISDNQRCPCGSKKNYGKCCGGSAPTQFAKEAATFDGILGRAVAKIQGEDYAAAEQLCRRALAQQPEHPKANHLRGFALYKLHRYVEASAHIRKAGTSTGWRDLALRHHYARVLSARLWGCSTASSAQLRCRYDHWLASRPSRAGEPLVSMVLLCREGAAGPEKALECVLAQDYPALDLVLMRTGQESPQDDRLERQLSSCPFPWRIESRPGADFVAAVNEAVALARGDYIHLLEPTEQLGPGRITRLVKGIAERGVEWGFSAVKLVDDGGEALAAADNKQVAFMRQGLEMVPTADTVGGTFLSIANPAICPGNLFFSRDLFRQLEGFRSFVYHPDWDFCLRALWQSEPGFLPEPLLLHNPLPGIGAGRFSNAGQEEVEQILADYCALADSEQPPNPFAPSRATQDWGHLACALASGQARLPVNTLLAMDRDLTVAERSGPESGTELLEPGLNLVGFFRGDLGLGESVRGLAATCLDNDIPVNLCDAGVDLGPRQSDRSCDHLLTDSQNYRNTLLYINPDHLQGVWRRLEQQGLLAGRRAIGLWHWEIDEFPVKWLPALELVDEIWVTSAFVQHLLERVTDQPVIMIPHSVEMKLSRSYRREEFGLPAEKFLFLFNFDFSSSVGRKNPWAVIDAFRLAFPVQESGVGLVIKSVGATQHPHLLGRLQALVNQDPRIIMIDRQLSRDEMTGLQSLCSAYVSLHRAEGFGLGLAECMALGKPVIGTGYSGNLEFMHEENSCLVDFSLVPVKPDDYMIYESGWMWADPDVEQAAQYMVRLFQDTDFRDRIAARAARDIATNHSAGQAARAIRARLIELDAVNPGAGVIHSAPSV